MGRGQERAPTSKDGSRWRRNGKGPHTDVEVRVAYSFIHAPTLAWTLDAVELTHFSMIKKSDGWLAMLKGERPKMTVVAFIHGPTYREALVEAVTMLDSGHVPWAESKPPPWQR